MNLTPKSPVPAAPQVAAAATAPRTGPTSLRSVLVVDDEEVLRETVHAFLDSRGIPVHEAADGAAALAALEEYEDIGVVLLDVNMPGLGGLQTLAEMRRRGHNTTVVLMTGHMEPEVLDTFRPFSPAGVLAKPFRLTQLLDAVRPCVPPAATAAPLKAEA